ncbi:MAG: Lrp/AsnC family transcriptional regulator [Deltaproteobacteria bacterium]|jgi:DNA-binding Lrp family transcriptional regulator|nr:Lrp/AsnC family transcriptional regulator [Deltaproteobacteria bacterium]
MSLEVIFKNSNSLNEKEKALVHELSGDLPLCPRPFEVIGQKLGLCEEEVLEVLKNFKQLGYIRRIGAILVHQLSGFNYNAMLAWRFPEEDIVKAGERFASLPYVTHCYEREMAPGWPYNVYTMIHAPSHEELQKMADEMVSIFENIDWVILKSVRELKKESIRYYADKTNK